MTFRMYKILDEDNIPVGEVVTQAKLHEGFINSTLMRILHEVHGLVTPYSPDMIFQEERMAKLYTAFSHQEYEFLKNALGLISVNKTLDLEKAMKMLQWFKQSTCPCNQDVVRSGGKQWQLRPTTTVPTDVDLILQLPTISNPTLLQKKTAKHGALDQASLLVETSSISSCETLLQDEPVRNETTPKTTDDDFNQKMKKMFQNPTIQKLFPCDHIWLLNELCSQLLNEVKKTNPLKWVNHVNSVSSEVDELANWKDQMKQDVDSMVTQIQTQLYTSLDEMFGEMHSLFQEEEEEEAAQAAQDVT